MPVISPANQAAAIKKGPARPPSVVFPAGQGAGLLTQHDALPGAGDLEGLTTASGDGGSVLSSLPKQFRVCTFGRFKREGAVREKGDALVIAVFLVAPVSVDKPSGKHANKEAI